MGWGGQDIPSVYWAPLSPFASCRVLITLGDVEVKAVASVSDRFLCAEI